jgi:lipoprotein-anchoring transpeptidase ErfK/SrfK
MRRPINAVLTVTLAGIVSAAALFTSATPARAELVIHVEKSVQRMTVVRDGVPTSVFRVSTAARPYGTPNGIFRPQRLERSWFSRIYYNSPMPHSIFFHGGYAIHGTYAIRQLGGPASHGCIRLHPAHASALYSMVKREGLARTRIVISN